MNEIEDYQTDMDMSNYYKEIEEAIAAFKAKWPDHCKICGGWGLFEFHETHGFKHGPYERFTEPCQELPEGSCHRCGLPDMIIEDQPCKNCGWHFDDGVPLP
jgi:hypothetical protein